MPSVRITCDVGGAPGVTRTVAIDQVAVLAGSSIGTCSVDSPGARVIQVEFLDDQGNVVETLRRTVLAHVPVTNASAMLTTYFSFLTLLLDNKLPQAIQLGIIEGSRDQVQATLSAVPSSRLKEYALAMFDVREIRIFGSTAEVIVALPKSTNGVDYYSIRFNVDLDGFWRIEGL
ncbi:MAG: hypothetical protein LC098_00480 [Burkholderiales bacterium]|nr:hypothetical protein [Burkholderiales bacterium]